MIDFKRTYFVVFLFLFYCCGCTSREQTQALRMKDDPLPESFNISDEKEIKELICENDLKRLNTIRNKYLEDLLALANLSLVKTILENSEFNGRGNPLLLTARLLPTQEDNYGLLVYVFDPNRECNSLIIIGKMNNGKLIKVIYKMDMKTKAETFIEGFGWRTKIVSVDTLLKNGIVNETNEEIIVQLEIKILQEVNFPDIPHLVVSATDRNGLQSNFMEIVKVDNNK
jgi:hypothetical protein